MAFNRLFNFLKSGLDRASKSGKIGKEKHKHDSRSYKKHFLLQLEVASDFRTLFREFIIDHFARSEFEIVRIHMFLVIFIQGWLTFLQGD